MKDLLHNYWYPEETPVRTFVNMRLLLATYDWKTYCRHLQLYQEFGGIVHRFLDYIVCLVADYSGKIYSVIVRNNDIAAGGVSRRTHYQQKHLIFANMGDAGVVQCIWTVCRYHRTNISIQVTLMNILHQMADSPCVCHVKDVLKEPGNMLVLETILANADFRALTNEQEALFHDCAAHYASIVEEMLRSDHIFTEEEEIRVVAAVHANDMVENTLCTLLYSISNRVRDSTLRTLTNEQIRVLCTSELVRSLPRARLLVSRLIHRAFAVLGQYDTNAIDPLFRMHPA